MTSEREVTPATPPKVAPAAAQKVGDSAEEKGYIGEVPEDDTDYTLKGQAKK